VTTPYSTKQSQPGEFTMNKRILSSLSLFLMLVLTSTAAYADRCSSTIKVFRNAGESGHFFNKSYAYAVYPSIGRAGIGIGGARGTGCVYRQGKLVGRSTMTQLTAGLQLGGQVFSQIVFLQDERAFKEFTSGSFEFSAQVSAVAISAGASAAANTGGSSAGASAGRNDAATAGKFRRGMAIFTVARGGLMYEAVLGGQRFSFRPN
jgi:lipid-binding SYLF domain-containing protein